MRESTLGQKRAFACPLWARSWPGSGHRLGKLAECPLKVRRPTLFLPNCLVTSFFGPRPHQYTNSTNPALFGLGLGGSLLAGFGMAAATARSWVHMVIFAVTLTVTLYAVTDMEYPRLGLISIDDFDHFLVDAQEQMR